MSFATVTPTSMELTPMRVSFGASGSQVDLGGTLSNIVISAKYMKSPIKADQFGQSTLDRRVSGMEVTVTTEVAEIINKDTYQVVFPNAAKTGSGSTTLAALTFNEAIGDGDLTYAKLLTLHPLSIADANTTMDYNFYKACSSSESTITYGPTEQARLKIVWNILPDTSTTPARYFKYGTLTI